MKPIIYTSKEDPEVCFLADEHSVSVAKGPLGEHRMFYFSSVRIGTLRPGPVKNYGEIQNGVCYPHPQVFCIMDAKKLNKMSYDGENAMECPKGIYKESATALLNLAAAYFNVSESKARGSFSFGDPIKESIELPWDEWKFITAWRWSEWKRREIDTQKRITLNQRWKEMSADGYPRGEKAFQRMHRSLFGKPTDSTASS